MDDLYRDYILEHYRRPHNFGVIEDATASFEGSNPLCGDRITMQLGIENGTVERVGFTGRGCAISQASASLLTDEIKGKPVADVAALRGEERADAAGAIEDDLRVPIGDLALDRLLDVALADVDGPRHEALLPLGFLAHVDEDGVTGREGLHLLWGDLADLGSSLAEEVVEGAWHGR